MFNKCCCRRIRKMIIFHGLEKTYFADGTMGLGKRWTKCIELKNKIDFACKNVLLGQKLIESPSHTRLVTNTRHKSYIPTCAYVIVRRCAQ